MTVNYELGRFYNKTAAMYFKRVHAIPAFAFRN